MEIWVRRAVCGWDRSWVVYLEHPATRSSIPGDVQRFPAHAQRRSGSVSFLALYDLTGWSPGFHIKRLSIDTDREPTTTVENQQQQCRETDQNQVYRSLRQRVEYHTSRVSFPSIYTHFVRRGGGQKPLVQLGGDRCFVSAFAPQALFCLCS